MFEAHRLVYHSTLGLTVITKQKKHADQERVVLNGRHPSHHIPLLRNGTPCTLHPAPDTLHPTPYTLQPTPCTLHPTPNLPHPTPYTLHLTPNTLHLTPNTLHLTPNTLHLTPNTLHPTPYTLHRTPYTLHPTPYTLHPTPYAGAGNRGVERGRAAALRPPYLRRANREHLQWFRRLSYSSEGRNLALTVLCVPRLSYAFMLTVLFVPRQVRAIGVSNVDVPQLCDMLTYARHRPSVNQVQPWDCLRASRLS